MPEAAAQPSRPQPAPVTEPAPAGSAVPLALLVEQTAATPLQAAARAELVTVAVESVEADGAVFRLGAGTSLVRARRAAGCLVQPEPGDLVLAACTAGLDPLIIAVLVRATTAPATLSVPEAEGLTLSAPVLALRAPSLEVEAETGRFTITDSHVFGRAAHVVLDTAETLYTTLQQYAEKLVVKAAHALRIVDGVDSTIAATVLIQAKQAYVVQATQIVTSASEDVRLDGERISMG